MTTASPHRWRFARVGGIDQVCLDTGADVAALHTLDPKLWVALCCPVKGLEIDERTLALVDTDGDSRIRIPEVLAAIRFCSESLQSLDGLLAGTDVVPLASLHPEGGKALRASAAQVLRALDKGDAGSISIADVADTHAIFAKTRFNGDGIIIVESADDPAQKKLIGEVIEAMGPEADRSGAPGASQAKIDAFFEALAALDAWQKAADADRAAILPLGEATVAAVAAVAAVKAKLDDWFARCSLAAYDPRVVSALNHAETEYVALVAKDLSANATELAGFPLATVAPNASLPLGAGLNPAWAAAMGTFVKDALTPILGARTSLTSADWTAVQAKLSAHVAWATAKPATKADALGIDRVREILASNGKAALTELVEKDKSTEAEFAGIVALERLVRYHRDLYRLLVNFTCFSDFYSRARPAIFQAGTLFLDSRSCDLCIRVEDAGKHAALAGMAKCYLAYCDCVRKGSGGGEKMQIVAVFSGGDSDFLMVGRNGLFFDRKGQDWDATIVKVVENPISLREAFWAPYKRFVRFVEEQVAKRAAAADTASTAQLASAADTTANVDKAAPAKAGGGFDLSTIALIGVAVSGAAAVVGSLLAGFFGLGMFMPLGIIGVVLLISGPSMLIAALKLRQRNLGPLLDANGWAINGRVKVNIPFGGSLTKMPTFPPGSRRTTVDPYAQKRSIWPRIGIAAVVIAALCGVTVLAYHQGWMPDVVEANLHFLGVPKHLRDKKELAQTSVDEARQVLASAQEQQTAAKVNLDGLIAAGTAPQPKMDRAQSRLQRAEAKLARAEDRLDVYEERLERATESLDVAIDAEEARIEAAEASEIVVP